MTAVAICPSPYPEPAERGSARERSRLERHKVVIHAAVAALFGEGAVVREIREVPRSGAVRWTLEGRGELHSAHNTSGPMGGIVPCGAWERQR